MPRRISVAARFPRQHEKEKGEKTPSNAQSSCNEKEGEVAGNTSEETKSWSYLFFGSQHSLPRHPGEKDSLEYLDLLPPKALREEEYKLSALMVHSR
jgi:hypothetical protein